MKQSKAEVIAINCLQHQCIEKEHYAYYCYALAAAKFIVCVYIYLCKSQATVDLVYKTSSMSGFIYHLFCQECVFYHHPIMLWFQHHSCTTHKIKPCNRITLSNWRTTLSLNIYIMLISRSIYRYNVQTYFNFSSKLNIDNDNAS